MVLGLVWNSLYFKEGSRTNEEVLSFEAVFWGANFKKTLMGQLTRMIFYFVIEKQINNGSIIIVPMYVEELHVQAAAYQLLGKPFLEGQSSF